MSPELSALRNSHERFRTLVAPLGPDEVRRRAYPTEWSIAQVASHLGSGAQINELALDAGLAGTGPVPREAYPPIWDEWNAKSPDAQVRDAVGADARLVSRVEGLDQEAPHRFPLWVGEVDVAGFAVARLMEHAVHTWDIAVALDPSATVADDAVPLVLAGIRGLVRFAAKPQGRTGHVRFTTEGGDYLFSYGDDGASLDPVPGADTPDRHNFGEVVANAATVSLPGEALVRLVYGRLDEAHCPPVQASGVTLDELRTMFPGF